VGIERSLPGRVNGQPCNKYERVSLAMDRRTRRWNDQLSQVVLHLDKSTFTWAGITQPIEDIGQYTDNYLNRGEKLSADDQDEHLRRLISAHSDQIRAVLACSHALSPSALQEQLRPIGANSQTEQEILTFLQIIITAKELNAAAIPTQEAKWVNCFKKLMSGDADGAYAAFKSYDQLVVEGTIPILLTSSTLHCILEVAIKRLGLHLEKWKAAGEWTKAYRNTRWMRKVSSSLSHLKSILDIHIQHWESWALWKPDMLHLQGLDELTNNQRTELKDIFTLEGPDFKSSPPKSRLLAAVIVESTQDNASDTHYGVFRLRGGNGLSSLVNSLLIKVVKACKESERAGAIACYIVKNNVINEGTLGALDAIETTDPSLLLTIYEAVTTNVREIRLSAVTKIIPLLATSQMDLQKGLSPLISLALRDSVSALQDKFNDNLREGNSLKNVGKKLFRIASLIRQNPWLQDLIDQQVWSVMSNYPSSDNMTILFELREDTANDKSHAGVTFRSLIDMYCISVFTGHEDLDFDARVVIEHLFGFWRKEYTLDRRRLAINIATRNSIPSNLRCELFEDIHRMSEDFCEIVLTALFHTKEQGCIDFARTLASYRKLDREERTHWQAVLKSMVDIQSSTLLNYAVTNLSMDQWFQWLRDIRSQFPHSHRGPSQALNPEICDWAALCSWAARLEDTEMEAMVSLEKLIGMSRLRKIFLVPKDEELVILFLDMVKELNRKDCYFKPIYDQILARLAPDWSNLPNLGRLITHLDQTSNNGRTMCLQLVEYSKTLPMRTCKGVFQVWLAPKKYSANAPPQVTGDDLVAIQLVGSLLELDINSQDNMNDCLAAACEHLNKQFEELVAEAARLKVIRRNLMAQNRDETVAFLTSIGITDIEDGIVDIPEALTDVIEQHSYQEFEITFPLDHLKPLQRIAMGVGEARNIVVRLLLEGEFESKPQFCVHISPEQDIVDGSTRTNSKDRSRQHLYWPVSKGSPAPDLNFCAPRANRTTYMVSMALWRQFSTIGFESLESVHQLVSSAITDYGHNCLVCGVKQAAKVFRATTCQLSSCTVQLARADYEVRLADLRWDPYVIDLLLLAVYATAQSGRAEFLLSSCPVRDLTKILEIMIALPDIHAMRTAADISSAIRGLGPDAESLLLWAGSYRGSIATPTGLLKIPNLPNVHQFVLTSTTPELEMCYNLHLPSPQTPTQVVFHGTTMNRLYPILQQGLQVGTGTTLLQNGASYGSGIYCAADIATSFAYAGMGHGYGWPNTKLGSTKLILVCELAGNYVPNGGIYVVTDPTQLRIRYIFLFPANMYPPTTHHIVPAIQSAFALLRTGTV
jgi:hypothetical protein